MKCMVDVVTYTKENGKQIESLPFDTIENANAYVERSRRYDFKYESGDFRTTFDPREVKV